MTERELFAAYRTPIGHYEAPCVCGDTVQALSSDEETVRSAVDLHNESTVHQQWLAWQEAVHALRRPTRRPCPCHAVAS